MDNLLGSDSNILKMLFSQLRTELPRRFVAAKNYKKNGDENSVLCPRREINEGQIEVHLNPLS